VSGKPFHLIQIRTKETLDGGDFGWLKARHHFVVTPSGNRENRPLGSLIVWNDDEIASKSGFPMHQHRDMEIITYVREGRMEHRDDQGNQGSLAAGDVQVMSAGTGITHSESSVGSSTGKVFQIWILPRENGGKPEWGIKPFPKSGPEEGRLVTLASGFDDDADALPIRADARVLGATLRAGQNVKYDLAADRYAYLVATRGNLNLNGVLLLERDGAAIEHETELRIEALNDVELVLVDAGPASDNLREEPT
jgi:redox-sensitive bicupin YhaK (pirin superfamily)